MNLVLDQAMDIWMFYHRKQLCNYIRHLGDMFVPREGTQFYNRMCSMVLHLGYIVHEASECTVLLGGLQDSSSCHEHNL